MVQIIFLINNAADTLSVDISNSEISYSPVRYEFALTHDNGQNIPTTASIQVTFPTDYNNIPSPVTCDNGDSVILSCNVNTATRTITITDYFASGGFHGSVISFIISGLRNPDKAGTFSISTTITSGATTLSSASGSVRIVEGTGNIYF